MGTETPVEESTIAEGLQRSAVLPEDGPQAVEAHMLEVPPAATPQTGRQHPKQWNELNWQSRHHWRRATSAAIPASVIETGMARRYSLIRLSLRELGGWWARDGSRELQRRGG